MDERRYVVLQQVRPQLLGPVERCVADHEPVREGLYGRCRPQALLSLLVRCALHDRAPRDESLLLRLYDLRDRRLVEGSSIPDGWRLVRGNRSLLLLQYEAPHLRLELLDRLWV